MSEPVFNPYLPLTEYIPDGEPHVFGDRVYIYGSHDKAGGTAYCEDHYCVWSAPVDDLHNWRCEGVSYRRDQDPSNAADDKQLWAPDVTQGPDGRYYLYYCFSFYPEIGVAVSDKPAGPFEYLGHVHYPPHILGGKLLQEGMVFDPAVLTDDDGRVYLYYGFAPACEKEFRFPELSEEDLAAMPPEKRERIEAMKALPMGEDSYVVELEPDMLTAKELPRVLLPGGHHTAGTGYEGHGFFEASSIRKIHGKYYFVYSSHKSHELCYAVSDRPDSGFVYGGTVVSNGDIGLNGRETPVYPLGNNHGGLVRIGDEHYIFYHRHTDGTNFSRQGMAERVALLPDGSIPQVEMTSCGLNGGPLEGRGVHPAHIACNLFTDKPSVYTGGSGGNGFWMDGCFPKITQDGRDGDHEPGYIANMTESATCGFKYFRCEGIRRVGIRARGYANGCFAVKTAWDGPELGRIPVHSTNLWTDYAADIAIPDGTRAIYLTYHGPGSAQLASFSME